MDSIPRQKQMVSHSKSTVKSKASGLPRTAKDCQVLPVTAEIAD